MPDFDFGHVSGRFGIGRGLVADDCPHASSGVIAETEMNLLPTKSQGVSPARSDGEKSSGRNRKLARRRRGILASGIRKSMILFGGNNVTPVTRHYLVANSLRCRL